MSDSTDSVRLRMLRESVDWDRIRRIPRGDSSLNVLERWDMMVTLRMPPDTHPCSAPTPAYPAMLVVETLLEREREGRPRRGPSSVWRKLSEG